MAGKNKLIRFADLHGYANVFENQDPREPGLTNNYEEVEMKGKWNARYFKNEQPIILELACGKGEYTIAMSEEKSERNYVGVDVKGNRIWVGATKALEAKKNNVAFLRTRIEQIELFFAPGEVSEIWITFPDPFLKKGKHNRRLTSPPFLDRFRKILKPGGFINLKTDEGILSDYTLEVIESDSATELIYYDDDIYSKPLPQPELAYKTYYEGKHLRDKKTIKYVRFTIH